MAQMTDKVRCLTAILRNEHCSILLNDWAQLFDQYKHFTHHTGIGTPAHRGSLMKSYKDALKGVEGSIRSWCAANLGQPCVGVLEMLAAMTDEDVLASLPKDMYGTPDGFAYFER